MHITHFTLLSKRSATKTRSLGLRSSRGVESVFNIEDLKIKNMSKSGKGTIENSGKNVKAKAGLNRSILNEAWRKFFTYLEYKLKLKGGILIKVDPKHTSQTCIKCGYISKDNRKEQETFKCVKCG